MIFDTSFVSRTGTPPQIVSLAVRAEELGFNAVWMAHDPLADNAWVICGAIAAATHRVKVGPGIVNPYSVSPMEIAMAAATLDNLSGGRCVLGIGPGARRMLAAAGIEQKRVLGTLHEAINYLQKTLTSSEKTLTVKIAQKIPLYLGCQSPKLLERIGRWGIGGLPLLTPPGYAAAALENVRRGGRDAGIPVALENQVASILVSLAKDEQEARHGFAEFIIPILRHLSPHQLSTAGITDSVIEEAERAFAENGWEAVPSKVFSLGGVGAESCIKAVEEVSKAGYVRVKIGSPLGPNKEEALRICANEIIPHFS